MIAQLTGQLVYRNLPTLVIDVAGVGYEIDATAQAFALLPNLGEIATVYTHLAVREDAQQLFGFGSREERDVFRTLIKISGVGGKMALAILSALTPADLARLIEAADVPALQRVPGVGKKTAERLIIELKGKLKDFTQSNDSLECFANVTLKDTQSADDATSGLIALGYRPAEADKMVKAVMKTLPNDNSAINSESLIRLALKQFIR